MNLEFHNMKWPLKSLRKQTKTNLMLAYLLQIVRTNRERGREIQIYTVNKKNLLTFRTINYNFTKRMKHKF